MSSNESSERHLYFAYGSNLNLAQMLRRCPTARPICAYRLIDWRLEFRGYADIAPCPDAYVDGALYEIGPSDLTELDQYEGYDAQAPDKGLYRKERLMVEVDGQPETALIYLMNRSDLEEPDANYLEEIVQGFRDWELATQSLYEARARATR